jgi:CubicO group peptidase (beta-lactamase class C family)
MKFNQSISSIILMTCFSMQALANSTLTDALNQYIDKQNLPGVETLVIRKGKVWHHSVVGYNDLEKGSLLKKHSIFRIFSMTKPLVATAMLQLVDKGLIELDANVSDYIPELVSVKLNGKNVEISIEELLAHTAGFEYNFDALHKSNDTDEFLNNISSSRLAFAPGTKWGYSMASDIQGAIIEKITGESLDKYLHENVFKPLNMQDTAFWVPENKAHRLVEDYEYEKSLEKSNKIKANDAKYLSQPSFLSGGGGLVSTAKDYSHFLTMMLNHGEYKGKQIIKNSTLRKMLTSHTVDLDTGFLPKIYPNSGFGLGLGIKEGKNDLRSRGSYYWAGKGGTLFWVDPTEELIVVAMMQAEDAWPLLNKWLGEKIYNLLGETH